MMFARLHKRALKRVQLLSTLKNQFTANGHLIVNSQFLDAPKSPSFAPDPFHEGVDNTTTRRNGAYTRIVCMSDTHGKHNDIPFLPRGDILVHAGDFTKMGETHAVEGLSRYFQQQQELSGFDQILVIAGNHDMTFQPEYYEKTWSRQFLPSFDPWETRKALEHCTYLEDSSTTLMLASSKLQSSHDHQEALQNSNSNNNTIVAYGSPWTPKHFNWAFNLKRGPELQEVWSKIPTNADVLITHGPPKGRGDITLHSGHFGCLDLLQQVQQRVQPRLHIYGHIHEGYGTSFDGQTLFVNASCLDIGYEAINPCIVIDLPHDTSQPAMVVEPQIIESLSLYDMSDLVAWLHDNGYHIVAHAFHEAAVSSFWSLPINDLFLGTTYQTICDQLGWKRRKHRPARQELRTALCQLYAESFSSDY